mmetsp:Transcript_107919/g.315545  ORF Transcript_107919/g.315545 Transcript_107919/m.315545 type:complete len:214 (+) Transcript_107919:2347-2988(+)
MMVAPSISCLLKSSATIREWKQSPNISFAGARSMSFTMTFASGQRTRAPISVPAGFVKSSVYFARPIVWSMAEVFGRGLLRAPLRSSGAGKACHVEVDLSMSCRQYSADCHSLGKAAPKQAVRNFTRKPQMMCAVCSLPNPQVSGKRSALTFSDKFDTTPGKPDCKSSALMPESALSTFLRWHGLGSTAPRIRETWPSLPLTAVAAKPAFTRA